MKKILFIFYVFFAVLFFEFEQANAKIFKDFRQNHIHSGDLKIDKKLTLKFPEGEWIVANREGDSYGPLRINLTTFVQLKNKEVSKVIEVLVFTGGLYPTDMNLIIEHATFYENIEGYSCKKYKGNALLEVYKRGSAHNCLRVRHVDVQRHLYNPPKDWQKTASAQFRAWMRRNEITIPDLLLWSYHSYFARTQAGRWTVISYVEDPKHYGAKKKYNPDRYNSEFHPNKINNFPEAKKIMQKFIEKSIYRHKEIERMYKIPKRHVLKFSNITSVNSNNLADDLKKLSDLYNKGALTKEEYEKAKKNLLK